MVEKENISPAQNQLERSDFNEVLSLFKEESELVGGLDFVDGGKDGRKGNI